MRTRPRLTDRDSADQLSVAGDRSGPGGIARDSTVPLPIARDRICLPGIARDSTRSRADPGALPAPVAGGDAYHWSDLRPEIGARGATVTVFMSSLMSDMAAQYLHAVRLTGFGFAVGCAAAASLARRRALMVVITTAPLVFLVAITCAEALAAHADHIGLSAGRICARVLFTLASTAPWLFGGFAWALLIAICRVLAQRITDRRRERGATLAPNPTPRGANQEPPRAARQLGRKLGPRLA